MNCSACNAGSYHLYKYGYGYISCVNNLLNLLNMYRVMYAQIYLLKYASRFWHVLTFIFFAFSKISFFRPIPSYIKYLKTFQIELGFWNLNQQYVLWLLVKDMKPIYIVYCMQKVGKMTCLRIIKISCNSTIIFIFLYLYCTFNYFIQYLGCSISCYVQQWFTETN